MSKRKVCEKNAVDSFESMLQDKETRQHVLKVLESKIYIVDAVHTVYNDLETIFKKTPEKC